MGILTIVDGIERYANHREPTGVECDACQTVFRKKPFPDANTYQNSNLIIEARKLGWEVNSINLNFNNMGDFCPGCK
jgi:hypothetical protein